MNRDHYDEKNWIPQEKHRYKAGQLWFPLAKVVGAWDDDFHQLMLHDKIRMVAYRDAITNVVSELLDDKNDGVVRILDLGTGNGILAYWAAMAALNRSQSNRVRIYAIDANPVTCSRAALEFARNGVLWTGNNNCENAASIQKECITVWNSSSQRFGRVLSENSDVVRRFDSTAPANDRRKFDIIISEILGNLVDNKNGVQILDEAIDEFLAPNGVSIPSRVELWLVPIAERSPQESLHHQVADPNLIPSSINEQYKLINNGNRFDELYDAIICKQEYLAEPQMLKSWEHCIGRSKDRTRYSFDKVVTFDCKEAGRCIGAKGFFRAVLSAGSKEIVLDIEGDNCSPTDLINRNTSDCWKHAYLPIEKTLDVKSKDRLALTYKREAPALSTTVKYSWTFKKLQGEEVQQSTEYPRPFALANSVNNELETLCYGLELSHNTDKVIPASEKMLSSLVKQVLSSETLAPFSRDSAAGKSNLKEYFEHHQQLAKASGLAECGISFRFQGDVQDKILNAVYKSNGIKTSFDNFNASKIVSYTVYKNSPDSFVSLSVISKDELRERLNTSENWFESYLLIPQNCTLVSRADDELCALMRLVQLRFLLGELVDRSTTETSSAILHDLAHFGLLVGYKISKDRQVNEQDATSGYELLPFPELLKAVGNRILLWSGRNTEALLEYSYESFTSGAGSFQSHSLSNVLEACWNLALDNLRLYAVHDLDLNIHKDEDVARKRLEFVNSQAMKDALKTESANNAFPFPETIPTSLLAQWFVLRMTEYLWHGAIDSPIEFRFEDNDSEYRLTFANKPRGEPSKPHDRNDLGKWLVYNFQMSKSKATGVFGVSGSLIESRLRRELACEVLELRRNNLFEKTLVVKKRENANDPNRS